MNNVTAKLNEIALHKFQLASEFLTLYGQLQTIFDSYRYNLSKTKTVLGYSATSAAVIDNRDLEPVIRVAVSADGTFSLSADGIEPQVLEKHPPLTCQFRPFGILEPRCAREARRDVAKTLPVICEIASIKYKLQQLHKESEQLTSHDYSELG